MSTNPFRPRTFGSTVWAALILRHPEIQQWGEYHACRVATIDNLDKLIDEQTEDTHPALSVSSWIRDSTSVEVAEALSVGFPVGYGWPTRANLIHDLGSVIRDLHDAVGTATSSLDPNVRRNAGEQWSIDHVPPNMFGGILTWSAWTVLWGFVRNGIPVSKFDPSTEQHPIDAFRSWLVSYCGDAVLTLPKSTIALLLEEWVRVVGTAAPAPAAPVRPKPGDRLVITSANLSATGYPEGQVVVVTENTPDDPRYSLRVRAVDGPITNEMFIPAETAENRGWEFETTPFIPDTVTVEEMERRIREAVDEAVERVTAKWRADVDTIADRFWKEAEQRRWCSEADGVIDDLNDEIVMTMRTRSKRYRVEYRGTLLIPFTYEDFVTARNADTAWEESEYPDATTIARQMGLPEHLHSEVDYRTTDVDYDVTEADED